MTDTSEDRFIEECKRHCSNRNGLFPITLAARLIGEVERLRGWISKYKKMSKSDFHLQLIDSLTKELESVKSDRDMAEEVAAEHGMELEAVKKERDGLDFEFDKKILEITEQMEELQSNKQNLYVKNNSLKKENADLKQKLAEAENDIPS